MRAESWEEFALDFTQNHHPRTFFWLCSQCNIFCAIIIGPCTSKKIIASETQHIFNLSQCPPAAIALIISTTYVKSWVSRHTLQRAISSLAVNGKHKFGLLQPPPRCLRFWMIHHHHLTPLSAMGCCVFQKESCWPKWADWPVTGLDLANAARVRKAHTLYTRHWV